MRQTKGGCLRLKQTQMSSDLPVFHVEGKKNLFLDVKLVEYLAFARYATKLITGLVLKNIVILS